MTTKITYDGAEGDIEVVETDERIRFHFMFKSEMHESNVWYPASVIGSIESGSLVYDTLGFVKFGERFYCLMRLAGSAIAAGAWDEVTA